MKQSVKNSRIIGIDLGTANSVACYLDDTGQPRVIPAADGDLKIPSVVYAERGEVLVGNAARNMQVVSPEHVVFEFKRDVGTDKTYFTDGNITVTPGWCQTQVIKELRKAAIKYFDDDRAASQAVITVPAYFKERERQSVKQSAEQAGIEVLGLINEPTASGLAYG